jgi:hypothetical protein
MILYVAIASIAVFSWKFFGYLIPERWITPKVRAFSERVTIALLAGLVAVQGLTSAGELAFDARIPALLLAGVLLWLRVPFFMVIVAAAGMAAGLRALGFEEILPW